MPALSDWIEILSEHTALNGPDVGLALQPSEVARLRHDLQTALLHISARKDDGYTTRPFRPADLLAEEETLAEFSRRA